MAQTWDVSVIDGSLDVLSAGAVAANLCVGAPADYAEATTQLGTGNGKMVATYAVSSGEWTKANADAGSGRMITPPTKTATPGATGTADHIAYVSGSVLLHVSPMVATPVTSGSDITYPVAGTKKIYNRDLTLNS